MTQPCTNTSVEIPRDAIFVPWDGNWESEYPFEVLESGLVAEGRWFRIKLDVYAKPEFVRKKYKL